MKETSFPTSLFDFDFIAEENEKSVKEAIETREVHRASLMADPWEDTPAEPCYIIEEKLEELRSLAEAALDAERMEAYFRLLDEIERWERAEVLEA